MGNQDGILQNVFGGIVNGLRKKIERKTAEERYKRIEISERKVYSR